MIKSFVKKWNRNSDALRERIACSKNHSRWNYIDLLEMTIETVLNDEMGEITWDTSEIVGIDQGDYQGTLLFIFHKKHYQPSCADYIITYADYGSCSVCDTLQRIQEDAKDNFCPTEEQIADYMTLCLHLVQRMKCPYYNEYYNNEELGEVV